MICHILLAYIVTASYCNWQNLRVRLATQAVYCLCMCILHVCKKYWRNTRIVNTVIQVESSKGPKPVVMWWPERVLPWRLAFLSIFPNETAAYFVITAPPIISHKCPIPISPLCLNFTLRIKFFSWWTLMCQPVLVLPHLTHNFLPKIRKLFTNDW